ncbi:magnesium Mg(2+) and cobalt Co(2+) transport protein [Longilinea arvoryzae]|uniref:Magnesium transport protein CorA n=1 Tax=Longilinea arvoryzae TaxID=360412 RepID=A0A0S7BLB1_9CHLR|nr:magnesium/cobalt transporter CorA [Longilinea arvoryzae]GAP14962.1 magnesium Mg(2+) and cobalt Co(2+) transport protein [Longilinea arvoryzae]
MIRSIYFPPREAPIRNLPVEQYESCIQEPEGLLWVILEKTNPDEIRSILADAFHFHPLAVEDCIDHGYQTPKIDDFEDYLFIITHAILPSPEISEDDVLELDLFLGANYLVTVSTEQVMPPVEKTWKLLAKDKRLHAGGADFLCHAVLDILVDDYMPLLDNMEDEIEKLEDLVLAKPKTETLERILALKHSIMVLRHIIWPQREVINRLSRDEFPMIDQQSRIYFRDIYDHLMRIQEMSENIRDVVSGSLDIYLNSTSLRLNEVMKALTIVSTIFLPLSFVAGNFGMNFKFMPELNWQLGYPMVLGIYLLIVGGMLYFFKRRGWF